jgi:hypothetical protein
MWLLSGIRSTSVTHSYLSCTTSTGIQDENEPGIEGVGVSLYDHKTKSLLPHAEEMSDGTGMIKFTAVPKGIPLRVKVTTPLKGAKNTLRKKGGNDALDSDLDNNGLSAIFRLKGTATTWTNTALGYVLPQDVEIKVFNDLNGNGLQDAGELGIKGVVMGHVTRKKNVHTNLADQDNGGNSHTELTTDERGVVTFTGVPQFVKMQVNVIDAPDGAVPTKINAGEDDTVDSDLRGDGKSVDFVIKGGSGAVSHLDLGYRMPETVNVRVWADSNSNGKERWRIVIYLSLGNKIC